MTSPFRAWLLAIRIRTLTAGFLPVAVGSALAFHDGRFQILPGLGALLAALLIQIGTNLINDAWDFRRGADTADRLGPARASQRGLLPPQRVLAGGFGSFAAAFLLGLYLVWVGGVPILVIGLAAIAAGYFYTGGPFPLAYRGLGDLFVLTFFGYAGVVGTYYLHAQEVSRASLVAALPVGLLGVALLAVNNLRDQETDRRASKRTLVVRFGAHFGIVEYVACIGVSFAIPATMVLAQLAPPTVLLTLLCAPLAVAPCRIVLFKEGVALNRALHLTSLLQLAFGLLFVLGLVW